MAQQTSVPATADRDGDGGTPGAPGVEEAADRPDDPAGDVRLERLLTVAALSPAQAVLIAARVLGAATSGADGWRVGVDSRGEIEVTRVRAGEGPGMDELLEQLTRSARRLPTHPSPDQLALLRTLEEVATSGGPQPAERAEELERALDELLGPQARERLQRDVGALVEAYTHVTASRVGAHHRAVPTTFATSGSTRARRRRRRPLAAPRPRSRGLVRGALLLVVVTLVVGSGFVVLRDPGGEDAGALVDDPAAGPTRTPRDDDPRPATRSRPAAATLAARQSGQVDGVTVEPGPGCRPGAPCSVLTTVRLTPAPTTRSVVWRVGTARWCGGAVTWSAPVTVTAQPGWTRVYATSSVTAAAGRSVALVALTTAPSRVQSPPVATAGRLPACSSGDAQR